MDLKKGLLCGLTNEYADFEDLCENFIEDESEKQRKLTMELAAAGNDVGDPVNAKRNKKNGMFILLLGVAFLVISIGLSSSTGFIVLPFGAIIYGFWQYNKGVEQEKIIKNHIRFHNNIKEKDSDSQ